MSVYRRARRFGYFPRNYARVITRYGKKAAPYVSAMLAGRYGGSLSSTTRPRGKYGIGTTNQYDRTNVYRKKRMPRRKRKRWVRFVKKVRAAENKTLGTRTRVYNSRILMDFTWGDARPPQLAQSLALYSCNDKGTSTLAGTRRDLENIVATDGEISKTGQIQMISGIFDMTCVNDSTDADGGAVGIELDVYLVTAKKRFIWKDNAGTQKSGALEDALREASNTMDPLGSVSTPDLRTPGTTPFDMTASLSQFGIKILTKKKYFLPPGNQMTYQMRDPKNRIFTKDTIQDMDGTNYPGVTKHLLIIAKTLPGTKTVPDVIGAPNLHAVKIQAGITRKYAYKLSEADGDKAGTN